MKKLSCSVESQTQPSYEWSGPGMKHSGPTLLVSEQEENRNSVYTCTVKDKSGSKTTYFNLQDCHTGELVNHSTQYLETLMVDALSCFLNVFFFAGRVSPTVLVPVLIVTVLLIILLAMLTLYLYRRKKQKCKCHENIQYITFKMHLKITPMSIKD